MSSSLPDGFRLCGVTESEVAGMCVVTENIVFEKELA